MTPGQIVDELLRGMPTPLARNDHRFDGRADLEAWLIAEARSRSDTDAIVRQWLATRRWPKTAPQAVAIALAIRCGAAVEWGLVASRAFPNLDLPMEALLVGAWPALLQGVLQHWYSAAEAYGRGRREAMGSSLGN